MPEFGLPRRERAENVVVAVSSPPLAIRRSQNAATIMRAGRPPAARPALSPYLWASTGPPRPYFLLLCLLTIG